MLMRPTAEGTSDKMLNVSKLVSVTDLALFMCNLWTKAAIKITVFRLCVCSLL